MACTFLEEEVDPIEALLFCYGQFFEQVGCFLRLALESCQQADAQRHDASSGLQAGLG